MGRRLGIRYGLLAAALVLLVGGYLFLDRDPGPLGRLVRDYGELQRGALDLQMLTTRPDTLKAFLEHRGVPFPIRVFDLARMDFELVGGRLQALEGTWSALLVYRGRDGHLICQMFEGLATDLPAGRVRENAGVRVQIHHRGGVTLVLWQEGPVVCILASDVESERLIELALAVARRERQE